MSTHISLLCPDHIRDELRSWLGRWNTLSMMGTSVMDSKKLVLEFSFTNVYIGVACSRPEYMFLVPFRALQIFLLCKHISCRGLRLRKARLAYHVHNTLRQLSQSTDLYTHTIHYTYALTSLLLKYLYQSRKIILKLRELHLALTMLEVRGVRSCQYAGSSRLKSLELVYLTFNTSNFILTLFSIVLPIWC
jgi:hypothetical protein